MEEIKLWKVEGSKDSPTVLGISGVAQTKTEQMLEEILIKSPSLLSEGLRFIGRQVDTPSGTPDLLGVDEDGRLIVFELKRGTLTRAAVAQVVDYASYLAELSPSDLSKLISEISGQYGIEKIDDFSDWYQVQFGKSLASIGKPKMMLVGLGVDDRARRMVEFLANGEIEMSLITFHGFNHGNDTYLARQVEVVQRQLTESTKASKKTNLVKLLRRIKSAGVGHYFDDIAGVLRTELHSYEWPNQGGYTYYLQDLTETGTPSNRGYVSLAIPDHSHGTILLTFLERAIQAADKDWLDISKKWEGRLFKRKGDVEIRIASSDDWKTIELDVRKLCSAIVRGWNSKRERQIETEHQEQINDAANGSNA
jgi:hypothetical protein